MTRYGLQKGDGHGTHRWLISCETPNRTMVTELLELVLARGSSVLLASAMERSASANNLFVMSIYFSDPSNNPLEIATLDLDDPVWQGYDFNQWYRDEDPAPSLLR